MPASVTVTGGAEVARGFGALARDLEDMTAPNRRIAALLVPGVARRSPRLTGALAASWRAEASKIAASVTSDLRYAGPVEYGQPRRGIPGARMVRDTVAAEAEQCIAAYRETVAERGKRHGFA